VPFTPYNQKMDEASVVQLLGPAQGCN